MSMTEEQALRYSRHIALQGVGAEGQERIMASRVLIVGAGGLGSPVALYLAAAGVGHIGLADADNVSLSNLQRQVIHATSDVGRPKVESAREKMRAVNPDVSVRTYCEFLNVDNARSLIADYDFIVDATDNFESKFLINDICIEAGRPFSYGGVLGFCGQTMTHLPGTACLRCIYGSAPPAGTAGLESDKGVLGSIVGMIGSIQATETLKYLAGTGELLTDRLFMFDAASAEFRLPRTSPNAACKGCGSEARRHRGQARP